MLLYTRGLSGAAIDSRNYFISLLSSMDFTMVAESA